MANSLANAATGLSVLIALLALVVGAATLMSGARTARLQQMHDLFKEYLRLQFEYNVAVGDGTINRNELRSNLGGFKMYSLEEMTLWLRRERTWKLIYFWSRFHARHIDSWQATIDWHLDQSSPQDYSDFDKARNCYGPDFVAAVEESRTRVAKKALDA